jgi:hypothetical protein
VSSRVAGPPTEPMLDAEGEICQYAGDEIEAVARARAGWERDFGVDLVVPAALLERLALPAGIEGTRCGELALRGKEERVVAYGLSGGGPGPRTYHDVDASRPRLT